MSPAMTLAALRDRDPIARPWAIAAMAMVVGAGLHIPGRRVRFDVRDIEQVPASPVVFAANHTHYIDWIALRWVAFRHGRMQANWVKPRTYEQGYARFLDLTGNVPLASRGYLLSADVRALVGRAPTEDEYRALRDHLDSGAALPESELMRRVQQQPREILGVRFDPEQQPWRAAIDELFEAMMEATLDHTRRLVTAGLDLTIMPQGATAFRLTDGHPGALQASLALGLPIVPVGVSGFPQAFGDSHALPRHGGTITVRFGTAYTPEPIAEHHPFRPSSERAHATALLDGTRDLMERINALVDPEHRWATDTRETEIQGVARFI